MKRRPLEERLKKWGNPGPAGSSWSLEKKNELQEEIDFLKAASKEWADENERLRLQLEPEK